MFVVSLSLRSFALQELRPEDLIELKVNPVVRPRPPNATSLPALISLFQNEWDALMLETYTL